MHVEFGRVYHMCMCVRAERVKKDGRCINVPSMCTKCIGPSTLYTTRGICRAERRLNLPYGSTHHIESRSLARGT